MGEPGRGCILQRILERGRESLPGGDSVIVYTKPGAPIITASGGYHVLEALGYVSEQGAILADRKAKKREALNSFLADVKARRQAREADIWKTETNTSEGTK